MNGARWAVTRTGPVARIPRDPIRSGASAGCRFVSIVTVENQEVVQWRDELDPIAIFDAAGWPTAPPED